MKAFLSAISIVASLAAIAGCGSDDGGTSAAKSSIYCSASIAGSTTCYGYSNLNADQQKSVTSTCTGSLQGQIVDSCPTADLIGCCKTTTGGVNTTTCYYGAGDAGGSADTYQNACTQAGGTWSTSM